MIFSPIIPQQETSENYNRRSQFVSPIQIIPQQETSENYNESQLPAALLPIIPQQETSENYNIDDGHDIDFEIIPQQETSENYNHVHELERCAELYHNKKHQRTTTLLLPHEGVADYTTTRNIRELQPYFLVPSTAAQAAIKNPRD